MAKVTVKDLEIKDKKVIMRVDFNVPLNDRGEITDDRRIKAVLDTIGYILSKEPRKLILMSHLGRPKGKIVDSLRMDPVARRLQDLLGEEVEKLDDCLGEEVVKRIDSTPKRVILLENLRFHPEEEKGDEKFARELARLADVYINDAFATSHRAHASTSVIAKYLPSGIGFLVEREIDYLGKILVSPLKPFVAILGGAKVSDKIGVIENLLDKVQKILIGGAMAYTFLKSQGEDVGSSRIEEDKIDVAKRIIEACNEKNVKIVLPCDHLVVTSLDKPQTKKIMEHILEGYLGVDIGDKTIELFKEELKSAKTVLWNGPLGIFENSEYEKGTKEIGIFLSQLPATVVVGGGDTASACQRFGFSSKLSHISTGGGASLEFLEGRELPGIALIPEK